MDQKIQFIAEWMSGPYSLAPLCRHYGISRPTGYKWIRRYRQAGLDGLKEHSRRPHHHPHTVPEALRQQIIATKLKYQYWGPKKVLDYLRAQQPAVAWPADSTGGEILKRAGLVKPRKRRRRVAPDAQPLAHCDQVNRVWSADFKGQFRLRNGQWCYPLTVSDNYSRYLLACQGLPNTRYPGVRPWFEWVFRRSGLPDAIRTDNGAPFASLALGGLSQLAKWWIQLGIKPERIRPGKPHENGRHERMHRSLKAAATQPPEETLQHQQQRFNRFVAEYNQDRTHEALQRQTPSQVYRPSARPYPLKLRPIEYDADYRVRSVRSKGDIKWRGRLIYVSEVLVKEKVGLKPVDEHRWEVYYSFHPLGILDDRTGTIASYQDWHDATVSEKV